MYEGDTLVDDGDATTLETAMTVLGLRHHFGEGWSAALSVPVGYVESESAGSRRGVTGFGDLRLGLGYELGALWGLDGYAPSLRVELELVLPTGTEASFQDAALGLTELVQLGMASYAVAASAVLTQFVAPRWALFAPLRYTQPVSRAGSGFFYGPSVAYGLGVLFVPTDWLVLTTGLDGQWRESSEHPTEGTNLNSGGHWLGAHVMGRFSVTGALSLGLRVDAPFYADVNGKQVSQTVAATAMVGLTFGGGGGDDDDATSDGALEPASGPGDAAAVAQGSGEPAPAFLDVEPRAGRIDPAALAVPGRTTVVDFWAPWCEPCHALTAWLREAVVADPGLAVRRIDVESLDEAGQRALLGESWALPTVWILGPDGERLHTLAPTTLDEVRQRLAR